MYNKNVLADAHSHSQEEKKMIHISSAHYGPSNTGFLSPIPIGGYNNIVNTRAKTKYLVAHPVLAYEVFANTTYAIGMLLLMLFVK